MKEQTIEAAKTMMGKAVEAFSGEMTKLRTGRASLSLLDDVRVSYYGQMVPLNQVATLGVPDAKLITIAPWESKVIPDIEKAVKNANLGLNPINDGKMIRVPIPLLTTERRADLVKVLKVHAEEGRVAVRHARREAMETLKKLQKDSKITEDDLKKSETEVQKQTDAHVGRIDIAVAKKEKEITQV
ncbi:MAG: ribosome recycling factor [Deltaproteobacteria bacterium]|nr:ribosome recycling factor [Deltaproteobacteria bacterium]